MYIKELYVMCVVNNTNIKSHFIKNVFSYKNIYKYFEKYYKKKVILSHTNNTHLYNEDLNKIINWNHESLFLRVFLD
tara:strand:- start:1672 stop:1902 length:231 start_codon:yes stop_codon:yes gene_type:complete